MILTTFLLQGTLHASPLRTGLEYLPLAAATGLAAYLGPKLLVRAGSRLAATSGLAVVAGGETILALAPSSPTYSSWILPAFLVLGAGTGLVFVAAGVTAMARVAGDTAGAASGLLNTGHEFGGAIGVAVMTAIATAAGNGSHGVLLAAGGHTGYVTAAAFAGGLALLSALAVPAIRPAPDAHVRIH